MNATKSFDIPKQLIKDAYKVVKANAGTAGVDEESITHCFAFLERAILKMPRHIK